MKFDIPAPPRETGSVKRDIPMLYDWCRKLYRKLEEMFDELDYTNYSNGQNTITITPTNEITATDE